MLLAAVVLAAASCAHLARGGGSHAAAADSAHVVALLGGARNAACPLPGLATGGQPDSTRWAPLAAAGFRAVLDLRAPFESRGHDEAAAVRAAGLAYVALPATAASLNDSTFDAARALLRRIARHPAVVHCASGNRVGAVMIPWLVLDRGWDLERAVTTARRGGLVSAEMEAKARVYVAEQRARRR